MPQTYFVVETSKGPQHVLRQGGIQTFEDAVASLKGTMYGSEGQGVPIPSANQFGRERHPPSTLQAEAPNIAAKGDMQPGSRVQPDLGAEFLRGITAGTSEEGRSAVQAAGQSAFGDMPYDEAFQQQQARAHAQRAATEKEYPWLSLGAEVAGGAYPAGKGIGAAQRVGKKLFKGGRTAGSIGGTAATGGVQGGVYGAMENEEDRAAGLTEGGATGAFVGGGLQAGGRAIGGIAKPILRKMLTKRPKRKDMRSKAEQKVMLRLEKEGWDSGEELAKEMQLEMAEDLTAYEATGVMGERITKSAMRKGERGVQEAVDRIGSFRRNQYQRFKDLSSSVFGSRELWLQQKQKWIDERIKLGNEAYTKMFKANDWKGPSTALRKELNDILEHNPEVLKEAKRVAKLERRPFAKDKIIGRHPTTSKLSVVRHPSLEEWEIIRRAMASKREQAFKGGNSTAGIAYKKMEQSLRKKLDLRAPKLRKAREEYSTAWDMTNALNEGEAWGRAANPSPTEITAAWKNMSSAERKHALWGYGEGLRDRIGGMKDSADISKTMFSTPNSRDILETILPDAKQRDAFMRRINSEQRKAQKGAKLNDSAGSATALNWIEDQKSRLASLAKITGTNWRNVGSILGDMMVERKIPMEYSEHVLDIMLNTDSKEIARMFNMWTKVGNNPRARDAVAKKLDQLLQAGGAMGVSGTLAFEPSEPKWMSPSKKSQERIE